MKLTCVDWCNHRMNYASLIHWIKLWINAEFHCKVISGNVSAKPQQSHFTIPPTQIPTPNCLYSLYLNYRYYDAFPQMVYNVNIKYDLIMAADLFIIINIKVQGGTIFCGCILPETCLWDVTITWSFHSQHKPAAWNGLTYIPNLSLDISLLVPIWD